MKPFRFRTTILTLVVVSGSAVTGVGLGRFLTKVVHARQPAGNAAIANTAQPAGNSLIAQARAAGLRKLPDYPLDLPAKHFRPRGLQGPPSAPIVPLPMWTYNVTASAALGGGQFTGTILGRSPFLRGKTVTTIPVQIIPLIITINDGSTIVTYDPTVNDPCVPGTFTPTQVIQQSPLFTNNPFTMNGTFVGNTQYSDAHTRAQFWSELAGTNYHLLMSQTVLPAQTLNVTVQNSSGPIENVFLNGACAPVGVMQIDDLDNAVFNIITGPLAGSINAGTFPVFLTKNVVEAIGSLDNCCVLGYHSAFPGNGGLQIYAPFSVDTIGVFGPGYTDTMSHEFNEAVNDPAVDNATPPWGAVGQVPPGNCQNNLEVGDPLSEEPGGTTTNPWVILGANGLTYHLQELTYFEWFFGGPSGGAGGNNHYSNNGAFCGPAILCPPGSTTFCP